MIGQDIKIAKSYTLSNESFTPMTIMNVIYTNKEEAGQRILNICNQIKDTEPRRIG